MIINYYIYIYNILYTATINYAHKWKNQKKGINRIVQQ